MIVKSHCSVQLFALYGSQTAGLLVDWRSELLMYGDDDCDTKLSPRRSYMCSGRIYKMVTLDVLTLIPSLLVTYPTNLKIPVIAHTYSRTKTHLLGRSDVRGCVNCRSC